MNRIECPRDVLILRHGEMCHVTAVDSCGGIGEKKNDSLNAAPDVVGYYTARTVLLEVMSTGAKPTYAAISVCNEPETAELMMAGICEAFGSVGDLPCVISTEKNMSTTMTALGISLTGFCNIDLLRIGKCRAGDVLFCAGLPLIGHEILEHGSEVFQITDTQELLDNPFVGSILPVGSRGIAAEAGVLAAESGLEAELDRGCGIDFIKSAGPSSCVLFSAKDNDISLDFSYRIIGRFK